MQRGDVFNVDLPPDPGAAGHEQIGGRPAVIVEYGAGAPDRLTVVVVPFTTNLRAEKGPGAFIIQPSPTNGLTAPSVLLTNQIRALDKRKILDRRGRIDASHLQRLDHNLKTLLNL